MYMTEPGEEKSTQEVPLQRSPARAGEAAQMVRGAAEEPAEDGFGGAYLSRKSILRLGYDRFRLLQRQGIRFTRRGPGREAGRREVVTRAESVFLCLLEDGELLFLY